jgi:hypothetical protein
MKAGLKASVEDVKTTDIALDDIGFDDNYAAFCPPVDPLYVPFGNYSDVEQITQSGEFFPYWIYGLSGNGKTLSIEQAHARLNKKMVLIPITREADEDSLLGGLRLVNGSTKPFFGPVALAALLGVTALLDEIDLGDEKLMCMQTPLQNRPFLIKRLGKVIYPKPGFNVVATANTKGQGSEDGKFIGTNVMNEAMLDRFVTVFEQDYPGEKTEREILNRFLATKSLTSYDDLQYVERLLQWAKLVRDTFKKEAVSEVITTRRLVHICRSYSMFGRDRMKSIERCISRFTVDIQVSFKKLYQAVDSEWNKKEAEDAEARRKAAKGLDPGNVF